MRAAKIAELQQVFAGLLEPRAIQADGHIFLGTPMGADTADDRAPLEIGSTEYRIRKTLEVIDSHDDRLQRVVELAHRDDRSYESLSTLSTQLANLLLVWSCNARDVHLLRGLPRRICSQASQRHDQSIKVACAAIQGCITLRPPPGHTGAWLSGRS